MSIRLRSSFNRLRASASANLLSLSAYTSALAVQAKTNVVRLATVVGTFFAYFGFKDNSTADESLSRSAGKAAHDNAEVSFGINQVVGKSELDAFSADSSLGLSAEKRNTDATLYLDQSQLSVGKSLSDFSVQNDVLSRDLSVFYVDSASGQDALNRQVNYHRSYIDNQSTVSSTTNLTHQKNFFDFVAASELIDVSDPVAFLNESYSDVNSFVDTQSLTIGRAVFDVTQSSEVFSLQATYYRTHVDSSLAGDVPTRSFRPNTYDTVASNSSGTLFLQGYVDNMDYFADDYVGVSRTF